MLKRLVVFVGLLEIGFVVALVFFVRSGSCVAFTTPSLSPSLGRMVGATPSSDPAGGGAPVVPPPVQSPAAAVDAPSANPSGALQAGNADVNSGQVPDPNCVAKTTAGMLNSNSSTTPPSCAPMNVPTQ